jgi:hypothetical protein
LAAGFFAAFGADFADPLAGAFVAIWLLLRDPERARSVQTGDKETSDKGCGNPQ